MALDEAGTEVLLFAIITASLLPPLTFIPGSPRSASKHTE